MTRVFIAAILVVGIVRFALTLAGLPNTVVRFASMTAVIMAGTLYFGLTSKTHKERLKMAYCLVIPYMIVEVGALGLIWATGRTNIFHAPEYSFGLGIAGHTLGHLVGGLTWEPITVFLLMEILWGLSTVLQRLTGAAQS